MELLSIIHLVSRGTLVLSAIIVLGLSIALLETLDNDIANCKSWNEYYNDDDYCDVSYLRKTYKPYMALFQYDAFAGAFAIVDALVGITAALVAAMPWIACSACDGLCGLFLLAGGIATIVYLRKADVDSVDDCRGKDQSSLCHKFQADAAFMIAGFLVVLTAAVLFFVRKRRQSAVVRYPAIQHDVEL